MMAMPSERMAPPLGRMYEDIVQLPADVSLQGRIRKRRFSGGNRSKAAVFCGFEGGFEAKGNQHKKENSVAFPLTVSN